DIPIVAKLFDFHKTFHVYVGKFPKTDKYTIGQTIQSNTLQLIELSIACTLMDNYAKKEHLAIANGKLDLLKLLVRLAFETRALDQKAYLILEGQLQEAGRMFGGWLRSLR
ncbi:MAG TPA: four helix bundle protein, partial [Patescibacteria group bacterium]